MKTTFAFLMLFSSLASARIPAGTGVGEGTFHVAVRENEPYPDQDAQRLQQHAKQKESPVAAKDDSALKGYCMLNGVTYQEGTLDYGRCLAEAEKSGYKNEMGVGVPLPKQAE